MCSTQLPFMPGEAACDVNPDEAVAQTQDPGVPAKEGRDMQASDGQAHFFAPAEAATDVEAPPEF
jgi:hypothetical protein